MGSLISWQIHTHRIVTRGWGRFKLLYVSVSPHLNSGNLLVICSLTLYERQGRKAKSDTSSLYVVRLHVWTHQGVT